MAIISRDLSNPNITEFSFKEHLTVNQRKTFNTLDSRLREIMMSRLLVTNKHQDLTKVRLTLDIVASCSNIQLQRTVDSFFLTILNARNEDSEINSSLQKLKKICGLNEGAKAFFKYASTKKADYYTLTTLKEIIDRFSACLQPGMSSVPSYLRNLPCYDEGGENLFAKLSHTPSLIGTSQTDSVSSHSSLDMQKRLDDLLAKSSSFKNMRFLIFDYFLLLPEANRLKQDIYDQFFNFLQTDLHINMLKDQEKSALLKIMLVSTTDPYHPVPQHYTVEDLKEMAGEASGLYIDCGEEVFIAFCQGLYRQKQASLDETIQAVKFFHVFLQDDEKFNEIQILLKQFQNGDVNLKKLIEHLEQLASDGLPPVDNTEDIKLLMKRFEGNDPNVQFPLEAKKLKSLEKTYSQIQTYCARWQRCRISELVNKANELRQKTIFDDTDLAKIIAIGRLALWIKMDSKYLHSTQVLTVLGLLLHQKGCIAQVKTGEGKSMIVALLGFVLSMQKSDVHIISSSPALAIRDWKKFNSFFNTFGITSSHICRDKRKPEHFDAQLLYGTASDYEFAIMEEMLHFSKLFPRPFANARAIVDEVDNLTIDTALNGARVGYPVEIIFNWIYPPIFKFLKHNIAKNEKIKTTLPQTVNQLRIYLENYQEGKFKALVNTLSNDQLQNWLSSAYKAIYELEENKNYIVRKSSTSNESLKGEIVIVDNENTGKLKERSRWCGGTHEFVEIKHEIEIEEETITPISISHPVFYPLYPIIYGLTGTIGSISERDEIKEIYDVDSFDVPTHKPSLRQDASPLILKDDAHHIQTILNKITQYQQQGRPILVLCKTIKDTQALEQKLKALQISHEMFNEKQQKSEEEILKNAGLPGAVTVATNNAGRGTDIELKGNSRANGGLHVLITFYPESFRVEMQARGRGGRQGEPGSSEILLSAQALGLDPNQDFTNPQVQEKLIEELAAVRKVNGNMMRHIHICRADIERFSFKFVEAFYQKLQQFNAVIEDQRFLGKSSRNLSNRLINKPKPDFSKLHAKDHQIAEEAYKLFQQVDVDPMLWVVLLKKIGERVKEKIISQWSVNFLASIEERIQNSKIQGLSELKEKFKDNPARFMNQMGINITEQLLRHALHILKQQIIEADSEGLIDQKENAQKLHDSLVSNLDMILDNQGFGVYNYLVELLGINSVGLILNRIFHNQEQQIIDAISKELNNLKGDIQKLYDNFISDWDKILDIQGTGIYDYLEKLLGIKLISDKNIKLQKV